MLTLLWNEEWDEYLRKLVFNTDTQSSQAHTVHNGVQFDSVTFQMKNVQFTAVFKLTLIEGGGREAGEMKHGCPACRSNNLSLLFIVGGL